MSDLMGSVGCYFPAPAVKKQKTKTDPPRGMNAIVGLANKQFLDCFQLEYKDTSVACAMGQSSVFKLCLAHVSG